MVVLLFAIGILCGAIGGLLMKIGASHFAAVQVDSLHAAAMLMVKLLTNVTVLGGMSLYFFSAVVWLYLLTKLDISFVQPILALTYVATPILAILFLHENVPAIRWVGILIIIIGVAVVARTSS